MNYEINRLLAEGRMQEMRDYAYQNNLYDKRVHKNNKSPKQVERQQSVQFFSRKKVG